MAPATLKRLASTDHDVSPPPKRKVPASTTPQAIASFFKPLSARTTEPEKISYKIVHNSVWTARYNAAVSSSDEPVKVALFDFDDTIVTTSSGNKFSRDAQDWKWWHATVPGRLEKLQADGYRVKFISNQAAVKLVPDPKTLSSDTKSLNNLKAKATAVLTRLDLPITMYAATLYDNYRKPRAGMWQAMLNDMAISAEQVDHTNSFFVGDAAGRPGDKTKGIKRDHSCSDRDFAANVGIKFHTPEEFFLNEAPQPFVRAFDPKTFINDETALTNADSVVFQKKHDLDLVLFCGSPGAGKSSFYWNNLQPHGYARVNQDILKTRDRCVEMATRYIEEGRSVAVDNTNADVEVRKVWLNLAKKYKLPVRLVLFTSDPKLCEHNDTVRALGGELMNPESRKMLPKMAFTSFKGRYQPPSLQEGFEDIIPVNFKLVGTDEQKRIWSQYWTT